MYWAQYTVLTILYTVLSIRYYCEHSSENTVQRTQCTVFWAQSSILSTVPYEYRTQYSYCVLCTVWVLCTKQCTVHSTVYYAQYCALCRLLCIVRSTIYCAEYFVVCAALCTVRSTVYCVHHCVLCSVLCAVCSTVYCAKYCVLCTDCA